MGDLSPHFSTWEFKCHGFGKPGHPHHDTIVHLELLEALESLRAATGRPIRILSGHRCPWWNERVGGAPLSLHRTGRAVDPKGVGITQRRARAAGFTGIGVRRGRVVHVDVRPGKLVLFAD